MEASDLVAELRACVAAFRAEGGAERELEIRLGQRTASGFTAGVQSAVFAQLECDFLDESNLVADPGWTEVVDYFYTLGTGAQVRTRVVCDTETMTMRTEHVEKFTRSSLVVARGDDPGDACRVETCVERAVATPPEATLVNYVRIKQRRCFRDSRYGGRVWRYELNKTWSGVTRSAVEHAQRHTPPCYEVECELVDADGTYLPARADADVAASLRCKMQMLLGDDADAFVELTHVRRPAKKQRRA